MGTTASDWNVGGALAVTGTSTFTGAVTCSSTLGVTGAATLSSTLAVTGATTLSSTLGVTGAATFSSSVTATGAVTGSSFYGPALSDSALTSFVANGVHGPGMGYLYMIDRSDSTWKHWYMNNGTLTAVS